MGINSGTSTGWLFVYCSRSNWNLAVLIFAERENPTYDEESGNRTQATLVRGECSHHCANHRSPRFT